MTRGIFLIFTLMSISCSNSAQFSIQHQGQRGENGPSPRDLAEEPPQPFKIERSSVQLLPLYARDAKIRHLFERQLDPDVSRLVTGKVEFGAYDYAAGVVPDLTWQKSRMEKWTVAMESLCDQAVLKSVYAWPADNRAFIEAAFGRRFLTSDEEILKVIERLSTDNKIRFKLLCLTVLNSLEFLTK